MKDGIIKVGAATPKITVADCQANKKTILTAIQDAADKGVKLLCLPELCITGATCGDLFYHKKLQDSAIAVLFELAEETKDLDLLFAVGLPLAYNGAIYNVGAVVCHGRILGFVPKTGDCGRQFSSSFIPGGEYITVNGYDDGVFGSQILFSCDTMPNCRIAVEVGESLYAPTAPSAVRPCPEATVILHLGAQPYLVGKTEKQRLVFGALSSLYCCAYIHAETGDGESTTDYVFAGENLIAQNGTVSTQATPFENGLTVADIDLDLLCAERQRKDFPTWESRLSCNNGSPSVDLWGASFELGETVTAFSSPLWHLPFIPADKAESDRRCAEILKMQSKGLEKRMRHTHCQRPILGISGGLDSTLALLVTVMTTDALDLPRSSVLTVTMPCFGTTKRTKTNAQIICEALGVTFREIPIADAVRQHLKDLNHPEDVQDVTYENAQARERTQILMDLANMENGMVIGTGDLSELALGFATYNGDHMSMYGVNANIPKTLVRHLVRYYAEHLASDKLKASLLDIIDTPVSPELLPANGEQIVQCTEDIVGPYELHDFFLFYLLRYGFSPAKIFRLACHAFAKIYAPEVILKWQRTFTRRFFNQQFKRSCLPDGVKVGSVGLSPRGDFQMPSDAVSTLWLQEIEQLEQQYKK